AYFGVFGYELDITQMTNEEKEIVKEQIQFYKNHRKLIHSGNFYRMQSPFEDNVTSWMVVSEDQSEAIVSRYQVLGKPHPGYSHLLLEGLHADFEYKIEVITGDFYGDELIYARLHLEKVNGDFTSQ